LGFMLIAPRSRSVPQGYVHVTQPNLQIKAFSNLDKVLIVFTYLVGTFNQFRGMMA
jgi:hypothetical protein